MKANCRVGSLRWSITCVAALQVLIVSANAFADEVTLQDDQLLAAFDSTSGALTRLQRRNGNWLIERRAELAVSFRLHAPLPDRRDNFVLGSRQHAAQVEQISNNRIRIQWKDLVSEHGGALPINLTALVTLEGGALRFETTVENNSPLVIETIDYPYLGDLSPPARGAPLRFHTMWYGNLGSTEIYPNFNNEKGYWGVDFPTKTSDAWRSLFCLIQSSGQGLYVEMHDPTQPYLLQYTFEQHPGVVQSISHAVPRQDEIAGIPVHLEFRTCHFIFAQPHSTKTLAPVLLRAYDGDWHAGVDLYKQWRVSWFKPPHFPEWVKDVHSWMMLQMNSPEEEYRVSYKGFEKYGDECAANGIGAIQLIGWNRGGQDRDDPAQDTDPGLGTWQDLHDAIAHIQNEGVKIVLFAKLNWADKTTDWYKTELHKFAMTDPYGIEYEQGGYSYHTPTQLASINNRRRAVMDFLCPAYRDIATKEFEKILALGSAGWLWDEVCHHGPTANYSFSPDHGYAPPGFVYAGDIPMAQQLRAAADKVNPDFLFAGEGPEDWLMPYYLSYFRINGTSVPICRYLDPQTPLVVAVTGVDDREMLNLILLDRYIIEYEPYNFKGHITDFPLTLAYGKEIDALRRKFKAWLWDADFCDTLGASVNADGSSRYSVFKRPDGKRAVVIVNQESTRPITAKLELPGAADLSFASPEDPTAKATDGKLQIPPRSAAVVMESRPAD